LLDYTINLVKLTSLWYSLYKKMPKKVLEKLLASWREALFALEKSLDPNKIQTLLEIIDNLKGKIIFTGLGKSGLIAQKIAASFSSIGSPALFMNSHEALHGDLGLISSNDLVIFFSNSGEGREISYLVDYCKKRKITTVGLSCKFDSYLMKFCDLPFLLPKIAEVSTLQIPIISTSMMLFWGDYLMLLLVENKNLTRDQYSQYHPAGSLGLLAKKVEDLAIPYEKIPWVDKTSSLFDLLQSVAKTGTTGLLVKEGGIIYKKDLLEATPETSIIQLIKEPLKIEKDSSIADILDLLLVNKILLVVDKTKIVGLLDYAVFN
jgi:arabinose-5-phosphate isomerase